MTTRSRKPAKRQLTLLLPAFILLCGGLAAGFILFKDKAEPSSTKQAAARLSGCAQNSQFTCYKAYFTDKTNATDPITALNELQETYQTDDYAKSQCHQIAHVIGRTAYTKYGSLPAAYAKGTSFCWSGYYHGVTEQAIGAMGIEGVKTKANTICSELAANKPYSFDHYNCAHGLGHGFLTVASFNLFDGLATCDLLQDDWERKSCYGGIYMENVMVAARGEGTTNFLKPEQPLYPCTAVDNTYKQQCYLMQTSYVLQQNGYNFSEAFVLCRDAADKDYVTTCYQSVGRDASGSTVSDINRTKANCDTAPDQSGLENCMLGAARDFVSYYHSDTQAKQLCQVFGGQLEPICKQEVATYYQTF